MRDSDEFDAWFRLLEAPGLGRESVRRLLASFGSPAQVLGASRSAWQQVVGTAGADALAQQPELLDSRLQAARAWLQDGDGRSVLCIGDADYPPLLLQTPDPPLLLYVQGDTAWLSRRSLAIVGSRNASAQGVDNARALPLDADDIFACKPVYESFPGWSESTFGATRWDALPSNARRYLERVQQLIGAPIDMVSTGPDREHTILLRHPYTGR